MTHTVRPLPFQVQTPKESTMIPMELLQKTTVIGLVLFFLVDSVYFWDFTASQAKKNTPR